MGRGGGTAQSIAFEAGAEVRDQPHEDLPFLPARKSGEEWQLVAKRR